jgi:hypothetical protein
MFGDMGYSCLLTNGTSVLSYFPEASFVNSCV